MSKFSKGDKARVISVDDGDVKAGVKVGDIVIINEDDSCVPYCVMDNGKVVVLTQFQLEHYIEHAKEITINGATYVLKEEPNHEHEWKFGDVAVHDGDGVGFVLEALDNDGDLYFRTEYGSYYCKPDQLTFIRRADLSI